VGAKKTEMGENWQRSPKQHPVEISSKARKKKKGGGEQIKE